MIKIKIWGIINMQTSDIVESAISSLKDDKEPILVLINSVGGTLSDAVAITNLLKSVPNPIVTVALGNCISAAAMIFALGKSRYIGQGISYMIHQPFQPSVNNVNYNESITNKKLLKQDLEIYKNSITYNSDIPKEILDKVFKHGEDLYLTQRECLNYSIATNRFTTWRDLYTREKIDPNDETVSFDVLVAGAEEG